jgi:hypothetical protein
MQRTCIFVLHVHTNKTTTQDEERQHIVCGASSALLDERRTRVWCPCRLALVNS